jgi:uncharacterized protein with HEPN domain
VLRHEYDNVDAFIIWQIVANDLGSLRQAVEVSLAVLGSDKSGEQ